MPRQPYRTRFSDLTGVSLGWNQVHPKFHIAFAKCIMLWSIVDTKTAELLSGLMGTHSPAMIEVFQTLRRATNQTQALASAAHRYNFEPGVREGFDAMLTLYKSLEAQRNDLAHGIFGIVYGHEDEFLIRCDPRGYTHAVIVPTVPADESRESQEDWMDALSFYRLKDLETLHDEMHWFHLTMLSLIRSCQWPRQGHEEQFLQRCAEPLLAGLVQNTRRGVEERRRSQGGSAPLPA